MIDNKLLFNLTAIQPSSAAKFHGGGYYGEIVFFELIKKTSNIIGIYNSKNYINPKVLNSGIIIYDINIISPNEVIIKENIEIFYSPLHASNSLWNFNVKRHIITWHGNRNLEIFWNIIQFKYARNIKEIFKVIINYINQNRIKKYLINKVQKERTNLEIITVSEHSKASIINFFPEFKDKIIPVLFSPMEHNENPGVLPDILENTKYFLLTSGMRWEKNNIRAIFAFDELFNQRKDLDFKVVLTGISDNKYLYKKTVNKDKFIFFDFVERSELIAIHKNAYAFIFPSLNEGFGYPPMESMRFGVPVAASGSSSIPEICQNAALYFDPHNISEIKNRIIQLLDKEIHKEYSNRAILHYQIVTQRQKTDLNKIIDYILYGNI